MGGGQNPGSVTTQHGTGEPPRPVSDPPRGVEGFALADLLPVAADELVRTPPVDSDFAKRFPRLWTCLYAFKTRDGHPRSPGSLTIRADGAVWTVSLAMPQEGLTISAESDTLTHLMSALEARLGAGKVAWREASSYVTRRAKKTPKSPGQP